MATKDNMSSLYALPIELQHVVMRHLPLRDIMNIVSVEPRLLEYYNRFPSMFWRSLVETQIGPQVLSENNITIVNDPKGVEARGLYMSCLPLLLHLA